MSFPFLNLKLGIRADGVQLLLDNILTFQEPFLHVEPVALLPGVLFDIVRHDVQGSLLAVRLDPLSHWCVLKTHRNGDMHMAVDDAGHDELAAEVSDLPFVCRKAGLVAHIDKFAVLHHEGGRLRVVLVRSENLCVFDDLIYFHDYFRLKCCFSYIYCL